MNVRRLIYLVVLAALVLSIGAVGVSAQDDMEEVTLILNWVPYGEHAAFYYGLQEGFFEEEGIDLTIQPGGGSGRTVQAIAANQATFGYADTPALIRNVNEGAEVKSIGVFLQSTPSAVQFFCDSGIETPADLAGRSMAVTPGDAVYQTLPAFMAANDMAVDDLELVNVDPAGKIAAVIEGQVDTLIGFGHDQGPTIEEVSGREVCFLRYPDYGVNLLSTGVLTNTATIEESPELVEAFMRAAIASWESAIENPEDAAAAMAAQVVEAPPENVLLNQWMLTTGLLSTANTEGNPPGVNSETDWLNTLDILVEYAELAEALEVSEYWDNSFVPELMMVEDMHSGEDEDMEDGEDMDESEEGEDDDS